MSDGSGKNKEEGEFAFGLQVSLDMFTSGTEYTAICFISDLYPAQVRNCTTVRGGTSGKNSSWVDVTVPCNFADSGNGKGKKNNCYCYLNVYVFVQFAASEQSAIVQQHRVGSAHFCLSDADIAVALQNTTKAAPVSQRLRIDAGTVVGSVSIHPRYPNQLPFLLLSSSSSSFSVTSASASASASSTTSSTSSFLSFSSSKTWWGKWKMFGGNSSSSSKMESEWRVMQVRLNEAHAESLERLAKQYVLDMKKARLFKEVCIRGTRVNMLAAFVAFTHSTDNKCESVEQLLRCWLRIAKANIGVAASARLDQQPHRTTMAVVAEALTLYFRGLVYSPDVVRVAKNKTVVMDEWCAPTCMPDQHMAAYDCEDGAFSLFHIMRAFQSCNSGSSSNNNDVDDMDMVCLQRQLQRYDLCFIIGELRKSAENNDMIWHAYNMLLPIDPVGDKEARPLILDSTNYIDPRRSAEVLAAYSSVRDVIADRVEEWLPSHRLLAHLRIPVSRLCEQHVYGKIHCIMRLLQHSSPSASPSPSPSPSSVVAEYCLAFAAEKHLNHLCHDRPTLELVSPLDVLSSASPWIEAMQLLPVLTMNESDVAACAPFVGMNAPVSLPRIHADQVKAASLPPPISSLDTRIIMRSIDELAASADRFAEALRRDKRRVDNVDVQLAALFQDCHIAYIDVKSKNKSTSTKKMQERVTAKTSLI